MATTRDIIRSVALRTGEDYDRVRATVYALKAAGEWNSMAGAIKNTLLALAVGAQPQSAASVVRHYSALVDEEGKPAGQMIEDMLLTFLHRGHTPFSRFAYRSWVNIYSTVPAVVVVTPSREGEPRERPYLEGHAPDEWRGTTAHEFTSIGGKLLFDVAADIALAPAQYV